MPRNGSGVYSLSDTIANATTADASELQAILTDIATALTGSMAADGQTPITGQMLGLVSTNPAWSFVADTNTGFGSDSADEAWVKAGGTEVVTVVASGVSITGAAGVTGNFLVGAGAGTFDVAAASGNTTIDGTLLVAGAATLSSTLAVTSSISGTNITATGALSGATATGSMIATQAEQEAATSTTKVVTPGRQQFHPAAAKAWGSVTYAAGTPSLGSPSHNVTSVTDLGVGQCQINLTTAMSSAVYAAGASLDAVTTRLSSAKVTARATGTFTVITETCTGIADTTAAVADINFSFWVFGDQ